MLIEITVVQHWESDSTEHVTYLPHVVNVDVGLSFMSTYSHYMSFLPHQAHYAIHSIASSSLNVLRFLIRVILITLLPSSILILNISTGSMEPIYTRARVCGDSSSVSD